MSTFFIRLFHFAEFFHYQQQDTVEALFTSFTLASSFFFLKSFFHIIIYKILLCSAAVAAAAVCVRPTTCMHRRDLSTTLLTTARRGRCISSAAAKSCTISLRSKQLLHWSASEGRQWPHHRPKWFQRILHQSSLHHHLHFATTNMQQHWKERVRAQCIYHTGR